MILRKATIKYSGIDPDTLKPKSNKRICCSCDNCGRVRWVRNNAYHSLCKSCAAKNKPLMNDKTKEKLRKIQLGRKHTNEMKEKNRLAHLGKFGVKGRIVSKKLRQQISKSLIGKMSGDKHWNWKGGISKKSKYCSLFNNKFKEMIRNRYHNKCYLCKSELDNNYKLSVHHVNYDKNCLCGLNCEFVALCISCHTKTNKNRQYWEDLLMCYLYPERYFMVNI